MRLLQVLALVLTASLGLTAAEPLRVLCSAPGGDYLPYYQWHPDASEPIGFDAELSEALAAQLGRELVFVNAPDLSAWQRDRDWRVFLLEDQQVDVVIAAFSVTAPRRERIAFSRPYLVDGTALCVRRGAPWREIDALGDGARQRLLAYPHTSCRAAAEARFTATTWADPVADPLAAVATAAVEAYASDYRNLHWDLAWREDLRILPGLLSRENIAVGLHREDVELRAAIDAALTTLEDDGSLAALCRRWACGELPAVLADGEH